MVLLADLYQQFGTLFGNPMVGFFLAKHCGPTLIF